jgi:hypothetical protein
MEKDRFVPWVLHSMPVKEVERGSKKTRKGKGKGQGQGQGQGEGKNVGEGEDGAMSQEKAGSETGGETEVIVGEKEQGQDHENDAVEAQKETESVQRERVEEDLQAGKGREKEKTFHRFYHLYSQGEIESEVSSAGGVVVESGYDRDNWWVVIEPQST